MTDKQTPEAMLLVLSEAFPAQAIERRPGGGNQQLAYVSGETVIRRLNRAAVSWDFRITSVDWRPWQTDMLVVVVGELTIPGLGTRSGIGVQVIRERGGEDLVKGAQTDALKKAAVSFGVALELYGPDLEARALGASASSARASDRAGVNAGGDREFVDQERMRISVDLRVVADGIGMDDHDVRRFMADRKGKPVEEVSPVSDWTAQQLRAAKLQLERHGRTWVQGQGQDERVSPTPGSLLPAENTQPRSSADRYTT